MTFEQERDLHSQIAAELWGFVARNLDRSMLESEEFDLWLVATKSCRERIDRLETALKAVLEGQHDKLTSLLDESFNKNRVCPGGEQSSLPDAASS